MVSILGMLLANKALLVTELHYYWTRPKIYTTIIANNNSTFGELTERLQIIL